LRAVGARNAFFGLEWDFRQARRNQRSIKTNLLDLIARGIINADHFVLPPQFWRAHISRLHIGRKGVVVLDAK